MAGIEAFERKVREYEKQSGKDVDDDTIIGVVILGISDPAVKEHLVRHAGRLDSWKKMRAEILEIARTQKYPPRRAPANGHWRRAQRKRAGATRTGSSPKGKDKDNKGKGKKGKEGKGSGGSSSSTAGRCKAERAVLLLPENGAHQGRV